MNFKRHACTFVACLLVAVFANVASAAEQDVTALAWLAGCWSAEKADPGSVEHWLAPAGGTMLGVSRTVKAGKTIEFEFMQLRVGAEGKIILIALPSGQKETTFTASSISAAA